jgi:hypothetical protein
MPVDHRSAHVVAPRINQGFVSNVPFVSAVIVVGEEYRGAIVSALDDVMKISGKDDSRQLGHVASRPLST